jgi:hypothetical protein
MERMIPFSLKKEKENRDREKNSSSATRGIG